MEHEEKKMSLDDLIIQCSSPDAPAKLLASLASEVSAKDPVDEISDELEMMFESWDAELLSDAQAAFCLALAALPMQKPGPVFREKLAQAIKQTLPPYLARTGLLRALGVRDENVSPARLIARVSKLGKLKSGMVVYIGGETDRFGMVGNIDNIAGTVSIGALGSSTTSIAMSITKVLEYGILLNPGAEIVKIIDVNNRCRITSTQFKMLVKGRAVSEVDENTLRAMARRGAGNKLEPEEFEKWFSASGETAGGASSAAATGSLRRACEGRSLKEIDLLLDREGNAPLADDEAAKFKAFFANLKPDTAVREGRLLAGIIIKLEGRAKPEVLSDMLSPLRGKAAFWAEDPASAPLESLSVWGELPSKDMENMAGATAAVFSEEYLAQCAVRLPLKALNAVCGRISSELLMQIFGELHNFTSDLLLWIWKNRRKLDKKLVASVNFENVVAALLLENQPKAWGAAQRELRALLLDNADFQKQLIAAAGDDAAAISVALQGALFLVPSERQSLLVKLSRISDAVRQYLEGGAAQKILTAGQRDKKNVINTPQAQDILLTSARSHKKLADELEHLVNVLVPENREALKTARAHGDLRENSEYDAAKERRNYLSRRRAELERELGRTQTMYFRNVKLEGKVATGCAVVLEYAGGKAETMYLLGAWDGDPDRNYLAYRTRLGMALIGHAAGDEVELPGGKKAKIKSISPLPKELVDELDSEN